MFIKSFIFILSLGLINTVLGAAQDTLPIPDGHQKPIRVGYWVGNDGDCFPERYVSLVNLHTDVKPSSVEIFTSGGHDGKCVQTLVECGSPNLEISVWPSINNFKMLAPEGGLDPTVLQQEKPHFLLYTSQPKRGVYKGFHQKITPKIVAHMGIVVSNPTLQPVLIQSAGNGPYISLSHKRKGCPDYDLQTQEALDKTLHPQLILAGGLTEQANYAPFTIPGENTRIQNCFLTVPKEKYTLKGHVEEVSGTSFAAPTILGAATQLKDLFPDLTPVQIRECLLESATRSTVFEGFCAEGVTPDIRCFFYTVMQDPEDPEVATINLEQLKSSRHKFEITTEPYSQRDYGKGFLSLRNAIVYAALMQLNSEDDPTTRRTKMFERLERKMHWAALKIQRAYKKHRGR